MIDLLSHVVLVKMDNIFRQVNEAGVPLKFRDRAPIPALGSPTAPIEEKKRRMT